VTPTGTGPWPGCHGVEVRSATPVGADLGLGWNRGRPLLSIDVEVGPVAEPSGDCVWRVRYDSEAEPDSEAEADSETAALDQALFRVSDGEYVLSMGQQRRLSIRAGACRVVVSEPLDAVQTQLLASFAIPILLAGKPVVVMHGAAAALDGRAVLVLGVGGAGKSSGLVHLVDAGWSPLSEDVCVVDMSGGDPVLLPGPPWVRRAHGEPGPVGSAVLFTGREKTAWDLAPWRAGEPAALAAAVIMSEPGGVSPSSRRLERGTAIGEVARHAVWLGDPDRKAETLFGPVASFAGRVPVEAVRLPRAPGWGDQLTGLLAALV
jgi:hypothetical protein